MLYAIWVLIGMTGGIGYSGGVDGLLLELRAQRFRPVAYGFFESGSIASKALRVQKTG
jgi:hypothetical protein